MSGKHGIYVAGFNDGYRVAYCGCIDEVYEFGMIRRIFNDSIIYTGRATALEAAHDLASEYASLGYGVTDLGYLGEFCANALKDGSATTMTAEEVLVRFMKNFHVTYGGGLEWSYISGLSVQQVEGHEFFRELSRYLDDKTLEDMKRLRQQ